MSSLPRTRHSERHVELAFHAKLTRPDLRTKPLPRRSHIIFIQRLRLGYAETRVAQAPLHSSTDE
jgi:hypothetical protein